LARQVKVVHVLGTGDRLARGLASTVQNLTRSLNGSRYTIAALFMREGGPLTDELNARGIVTGIANWSGSLSNVAGASRFARAIAQGGYDIVHLHAGGTAPRIVARSLRRVKVIAHYHSLSEESGVSRPGQRTGRFADLVLANSSATALTVKNSSPVVIHPGVMSRPRVARRLRSVGDPIKIGVASRLVPLKAISDVIFATAELRARGLDAHLEIAGAGSEHASLAHAAQSAGVADFVRFLGWVDDVTAAMGGWDVYAHASRSEGFGIALLEAMMTGLPVVAVATGGVPEVVLEGETGFLVPASDSDALADRIARFARSPELALRMGDRGRQRAITQFSLEREAADIDSAYRRVLA
jgi:glycosyltransferase involved in cell wall biosynthesis